MTTSQLVEKMSKIILIKLLYHIAKIAQVLWVLVERKKK